MTDTNPNQVPMTDPKDIAREIAMRFIHQSDISDTAKAAEAKKAFAEEGLNEPRITYHTECGGSLERARCLPNRLRAGSCPGVGGWREVLWRVARGGARSDGRNLLRYPARRN